MQHRKLIETFLLIYETFRKLIERVYETSLRVYETYINLRGFNLRNVS